MKIAALIASLALAASGAALAQSAGGGNAGSANAEAAGGAQAAGAMPDGAGSGSHAGQRSGKKHARKSTRSMGAGAMTVQTDLEAPARRSRMEEAYANWQQRAAAR